MPFCYYLIQWCAYHILNTGHRFSVHILRRYSLGRVQEGQPSVQGNGLAALCGVVSLKKLNLEDERLRGAL